MCLTMRTCFLLFAEVDPFRSAIIAINASVTRAGDFGGKTEGMLTFEKLPADVSG